MPLSALESTQSIASPCVRPLTVHQQGLLYSTAGLGRRSRANKRSIVVWYPLFQEKGLTTVEDQQHARFLTTDTPLIGSPFATWTDEQETVLSASANGATATLQQPAPSLLATSTPPTTSWMPLDELATTWADFGSETAASSLALTTTGTAFLALSWEASALRHHTWAWQEYNQCRTRNATRWYGQAMEDLTEASRQWSRVVMWLEKLANDEQQCSSHTLERTRGLIAQAMAQQQRLWHLTQEVQQNLLAVGGGRDGHSLRQQPGRTLPIQQAGEQEV